MSTVKKKKKRSGVEELDKIVRKYLMDLGMGLERYEQALMWGQDCYRDFRMDMSREIKTVELTLTAWKAIEWPDDYIDWTLIGVRRNGRLYVFSNDDEIPLFFDRDEATDPLPNIETFTQDDLSLVDATAQCFNFRNFNGQGSDEGRIFGLGAKSNGVGYYRVNHERREIQLNPIIDASTVYLEYICDGYNPCSKTLVPIYASQMIRDFIHWKRLKHSKSASRAEVKDAKDDYWAEFRRVQTRMDNTTIADIVEAAVDGYSGAPHF
jgi:hypothetical protein